MHSDKEVVMFYYYREWCPNCGYEAWNGQRVENGYDRHEDKSFCYAVPAQYH